MNTVMKVNGLSCTLHMPDAVKRRFASDGTELASGLPPGAPRNAYVVDEYPACPDSWMHGSGKASSYFVSIVKDKGMWLDFNMNRNHTHDVAVVISVQGINPVTGDPTDPVQLEQYKEKCPRHDVEFQQDLYCPECKFKWNAQNYMASNVTPEGQFWLDGFRSENGEVRQWVFSEEECKGVAAQLIGNKRVFAIGIAFYLSKEPKPKPKMHVNTLRAMPQIWGSTGASFGGGGTYSSNGPVAYNALPSGVESLGPSLMYKGIGASDLTNSFVGPESIAVAASCSVGPPSAPLDLSCEFSSEESLEVDIPVAQADVERTLTKLEVGAGAKIDQQIYRDTQSLDYWCEEPEGMIYINYCDGATADKIIKAGKRQEKAGGFLNGLQLADQ